MQDTYEMYKRLSSKLKVKLNKLTYRQYLALVYIVSKLFTENKYPSKEELKRVIGFKTDRMLLITLKALERKGFIKINESDSKYDIKITESTKQLKDVLFDKLLLIENYTTYQDIKKNVKDTKIHQFLEPPKLLPLTLVTRDLEYLNNDKQIVHRWYEYLEDFPPSLVWKKMDAFNICKNNVVLDPFVGSGTTCVTAKLRGIENIGIDANPLASFVTKVKTSWDNIPPEDFKKEADTILSELTHISSILEQTRLTIDEFKRMPKMELNQWLKPIVQNFVAYTKQRIDEIEDSRLRDVFMLALIEAAKESSNVAFCPGTSFYPFRKRPTFFEAFRLKLQKMYEDLFILSKLDTKWGTTVVLTEDSKEMSKFLDTNSVDFVFTSPPYPNDLEYVRQTKLELYLLGYAKNEKDLQKIKKKLVKGSTKLIYKDSNSIKHVEKFESIQSLISKLEEAFADKEWGWDYPKMVGEYFGDMYIVFSELYEVLKEDRYALFVVGDQTYKGILIPVGELLCELAQDIGFKTQSEVFRIRRSTLHDTPLKEEIVILKKSCS